MVTATKAGRYEILGELGRGGMGVVYRAKDPSIGRTVAVKTIRLSEEGTGMSHAQLVERFQTEARAAGLLTHPNIVVIYDVGESDGVYYITMELVNGKSLQSMLDSGEKFSVPRLLRIMEQVCSALQFAHDHNVVHRDIKPANIMLTSDDFVKITDFGTAKIMQYGASQQTSAMGTPSYMSPEQIKGKAVDGRTDIFSLGVMAYEMTTGQKPFGGQDIATILYHILNEEPVPPHQLNPNIPLGVSSTILKALTKSPHLRYENCRELLEDLKNYRPGATGAHTNAEPPTSTTAPQPPIRKKVDKNYYVEMPRVPRVEARSTPPTPSRSRLVPPSGGAAGNNLRAETRQQVDGIYAGPTTKPGLAATVKRLATIGAGIVLAAVLGSFAIRTIGRIHRPDSDAPPARQDGVFSTQPQSAEMDSARKPPYASQSNPEVATVSELAQPWSSKRFFFRSLTLSKYVPALIIRLPGPAAQSKSYWAFSLEAPFNQCQFEYIDDVAKLSSDYGFEAQHPMVVNPCSHTVFDPLQLKEIPGNILARGAIVRGYDLRPPYGIEVKVSGNQIHALAME
jgi:tRNA A-37 threonylcarbamoyl transferase component Bud32